MTFRLSGSDTSISEMLRGRVAQFAQSAASCDARARGAAPTDRTVDAGQHRQREAIRRRRQESRRLHRSARIATLRQRHEGHRRPLRNAHQHAIRPHARDRRVLHPIHRAQRRAPVVQAESDTRCVPNLRRKPLRSGASRGVRRAGDLQRRISRATFRSIQREARIANQKLFQRCESHTRRSKPPPRHGSRSSRCATSQSARLGRGRRHGRGGFAAVHSRQHRRSVELRFAPFILQLLQNLARPPARRCPRPA